MLLETAGRRRVRTLLGGEGVARALFALADLEAWSMPGWSADGRLAPTTRAAPRCERASAGTAKARPAPHEG